MAAEKAWPTKTVAVEILGTIRERLSKYVGAHDKVTVKAVVNAALDAYLKARRA